MKGDVNGDGKVNVIDARMCLQFSLGLIPLTSEQQQVGDVDNDHNRGSFDVLANYIVF